MELFSKAFHIPLPPTAEDIAEDTFDPPNWEGAAVPEDVKIKQKFAFFFLFCSVCFVARVGQVYFILSLFNSVPTNNYSFTIESENWWKSVITAIYYIYNGQNFSQTLTKPILHCSYMLPFHYTAFFALFCCTTNMLCVLDVILSFKIDFQSQ